jgi:hypothetical protein
MKRRNNFIQPDKCRCIKHEVKAGVPFVHADGTWYVKDVHGTFRTLIPVGYQLLYRNGDVFGPLPKPPQPKPKPQPKPAPTIEEQVRAVAMREPRPRAKKGRICVVG